MTLPSTTLSVKVVPKASATRVAGWLEENLKIRVQAPPEGGKANQALITFLARKLKCPQKQIILESGAFSSQKRLRIEGFDRAHILSTLGIEDRHG